MSARAAQILVIEDEPQIRRFLRATLTANGYTLTEAGTAADGLRAAVAQPPDLILLDLVVPDLDGLEVTQRLREWSIVPIIVLSARSQEQDKVVALDAGADEYLTKPFGTGESLAWLRVALRHAARTGRETAESVFTVGGLRVDLLRRHVWRDGAEAHLTPNEYTLLALLVRHVGKLVPHKHLVGLGSQETCTKVRGESPLFGEKRGLRFLLGYPCHPLWSSLWRVSQRYQTSG